jgi:hypothetical protein
MRKLLLLSLLSAVAAVAVAYGVAATRLRAHVDEVLPTLTRKLAGKLEVRIDRGDVTVRYFPLAVRIHDLRVSGLPAATAPFLHVDVLNVSARLLPLLRGQLEVREIVADRPRVEVLKDPRDARRSTDVPESLLRGLAAIPFSLRVSNGSVLYEDRSDDPPSKLVASSIDGEIRGDVEGKLDAHLEGHALGERSTAKLGLRLDPKVGPTGGDDVTIELDVDGASASALSRGFVLLRDADLRDPLKLSLRAKGLLGERSTETKPAEPLLGKLTGSVGVVIAGLEDRLDLDLDVGLDDTRYQVRGGTGTWAGLRFVPTGWITRLPPRKLSGRLDLEPFELADQAERFGVAEHWRPHGTANLTVRALGSSVQPLYRYEGTLTGAAFSRWSGLPIKAGNARVHGSLAAVNADATASFDAVDLQVGTARLDRMLFGLSYWRDKLTVTALESAVYGGRLDGSVAFFPKTSADPTGGMLLRDTDGKTVIENVLPGLPFNIGGRLDAGMQLGVDEKGLWCRGRVGLHRGRIEGSNWPRELIAAALADAGAVEGIERVVAAHRPLLGTEGTRFERVAVDFQGRGGAVELPRVVIEMAGATLRGRGEIGVDRSVTLTAALWPDDGLAATIAAIAPALGRARDASGDAVLPCEVRGAEGRVSIAPSAALRAALAASGDVTPLEPVQVGPADFGDLPSLRRQFGR